MYQYSGAFFYLSMVELQQATAPRLVNQTPPNLPHWTEPEAFLCGGCTFPMCLFPDTLKGHTHMGNW